MSEHEELAERVAALEERMARLEGTRERPAGPDPETFWALRGLQERLRDTDGGVLFTGSVRLPTGEFYEWQRGALGADLLARDWSELSGAFAALGHPVRLLLLRQVLGGARTVAELREHESLGTTGQLYHHLRQLVAAGWLLAGGRGQYTVPGARVVPLLVLLAIGADPG
ncbi:ArsR family transcriptional regulator [Amycolatopsis sp. NPDC058986]|uniref:ArsR family transcriptional regulator n=1 Tax=unclassified Amycolatopsis TaxID=2618356 RepID=UPI00366F8826